MPLPAVRIDPSTEPAPGAALATVIVTPPPPDLAPLVEYVWQLVLAEGAPAGAFWRVVADGYVDLGVRLPLDAAPIRAVAASPGSVAARRAALEVLAASPAVVCGAAVAARTLSMERPLLVTGARFRLGAAAGVLRNSPTELIDGVRQLGEVLDGRAADDVSRARNDEAARHAAACAEDGEPGDVPVELAIRALARESVFAAVRRLVARAGPRAVIEPDARVRGALHLLDRAGPSDTSDDAGGAQIARVCRTLGVSTRTLERLFAAHVGFAPRTYQRLRRVGAVAETLERTTRPGMLSDTAHRLGYTDHAHMTHEFGRVMGVAPSAYRREAHATPVAREVGAVTLERTTPFGTVGHRPAA